MKAILKDFYSVDIDVPLVNYVPDSPNDFRFGARFVIGEEKNGGEESFDITICTPMWLVHNHDSKDIIIGRHYLIVFEYDYQRIYAQLKNIIEGVEVNSWSEMGSIIGRLGKWEFEDYQV